MQIHDIPKNWNLETYFYKNIEDEQIEKDIEEYKDYIRKNIIEKYPNKLRKIDSYDEWKEFFYDSDEHPSSNKIIKVLLYLNYLTSLDTQNQEVIKKLSNVENILREFSEELLFLDEEFRAIGKDKLLEFSKREDLQDFSKFFKDKAETLKYELPSDIEKALLIKSRASSKNCNVQLFDELSNSLEFPFTNEDGETKYLTQEEVMSNIHSSNREIRKQVHTSLKEIYMDKKLQITFGNVYSSIVKDSVSSMKLRGFSHVMSMQNLSEDMDDETIDLLMQQVQEKIYPLYQRYLKLKQKLLQIDNFRPWDVLAPVGEMSKTFSFDEGSSLFFDAIKEVDNEMFSYSKEMFEKERTDVFSKKGKRGGAFCSFYKGFDSFVLLNYNNTLNDVFTLAHEFGHAFHGEKLQTQPARYYETPLCLAETASVFNELLLSHTLLETLDEKDKIYLLNEELNGFFSTICRQVMYTNFEKRVHEAFAQNKELTYQDFNILFREEQEKLFGDVVEFATPKEEDFVWSRIPHIHHTPFYCYSYAFGQILSISLYEQFKEEGPSFMERYKKFLSAGSSKKPIDLLKDIEIDINSIEFYENAEKFISNKIDEFEKSINNSF